jgi:hypothetical protein
VKKEFTCVASILSKTWAAIASKLYKGNNRDQTKHCKSQRAHCPYFGVKDN